MWISFKALMHTVNYKFHYFFLIVLLTVAISLQHIPRNRYWERESTSLGQKLGTNYMHMFEVKAALMLNISADSWNQPTKPDFVWVVLHTPWTLLLCIYIIAYFPFCVHLKCILYYFNWWEWEWTIFLYIR